MIKTMIVDDHTLLRDCLRSQIQQCQDIELVGEAGSAAQLLTQLATARPDVIILDIKLPDGSGTELIPKIKAVRPGCRIVILTMYDHPRYALHAMEQGADGFVVKGASFEELQNAIRSVAAGKPFVSQEMADKLAGHIRHGGQNDSRLDSLSKREFEVLTHLGRGLSLKETSAALKLSIKTVSTYKRRLMLKLQLDTHFELIQFAIESGLQK